MFDHRYVPIHIHTDQGKEFLNRVLRKLLRKYKVYHTTSQPFAPWQNGLIERFNTVE